MFGSLTRRAARGPAPRRARGDDGAAMVEAAIVMPLLMLLVFGIIEWGLAFLSATSTNSAARVRCPYCVSVDAEHELRAAGGARRRAEPQGRSALRDAGRALDLPGARVDHRRLRRSPRARRASVCGTNCIKYTWNGDGQFSLTSGSWPAASQVACGAATGFDSVGVYLKVRHNFVTNFFGSSKQIAEHTVMRLEPQPLINCGS